MSDETFRWIIAGGVAIATISIVVMAATMLVLFRVVSKVQVKVEHVGDRVEPMVESIQSLVRENAPRIGHIMTSTAATADNARDISVVAKDQAHRFAEVGRDITDRAKVQVARVDAAVDETVDQVQHLGENVKVAVMKPMSEVSGVLAGIKAGVSTYAHGRRPSVARVTQDEEMFI
jgi:hypothetical protein